MPLAAGRPRAVTAHSRLISRRSERWRVRRWGFIPPARHASGAIYPEQGCIACEGEGTVTEPNHFHPKQRRVFYDIEGFEELVGLALDMRSSWNHATDWIWRQLDERLWGQTRNSWVVLQTVSQERLRQVLGDADVRRRMATLVEARRHAAEAPAWFQQAHPQSPLGAVAYFSMEFMLGESLPIYSGGLGNVAGDQLKAAGDLGVPVYGVGLLYQTGYFRQMIDRNGAQQALYPYNDP